jgi:hypothetical protein
MTELNNENDLKMKGEQFSFTLLINKNIICHRDFSVLGFNKNSLKSLNIKMVVDEILYWYINKDLKLKTMNYLFDNEELFTNDRNSENITGDNFYFKINKGSECVYETVLSADVYPANIRYTVDIRENISNIIKDLQRLLTTRNTKLLSEYLEYDLF